jgi:hypothetical protein
MHYNEIKYTVKFFYSTIKKVSPFEEALNSSIDRVIDVIDFKNVIHKTLKFESLLHLKETLKNELQYEVNIGVVENPGDFGTLLDSNGHIEWYRQLLSKDEIKFRFWDRYKKYLSYIKNWDESTIKKLDEITDDILEKIENPKISNREFDRRGLVVGYVQSGKTANFMGLINKSIDCGYSIIIVLSGMHKNLRSQTQMRIDEEVIGRDTSSDTVIKKIGVCTLPNEQYINVDTFTTQNENGDFKISTARNNGVQPSRERPMIFVVKKNANVLGNLIKYFSETANILGDDHVIEKGEKKIINNLPLMIIDDEADQASPNTNAINDDNGELDPKSINRKIRELLNLFNQKVYIGYTATPFANIFIHHDQDHSLYGKDLFPSSFIISINPPSNYFGPLQIFGSNEDDFEKRTPIHISVNDASSEDSEFLPLRHSINDIPSEIPASMKEAIKSFILSSAIRILRGQDKKHNTMLIHCTRYKDIQNAIATLVGEEFTRLKNGIINDNSNVFNELHTLWKRDYNRISNEMGGKTHEWETILIVLKQAVKKIETRPYVINGSARDILDYKNNEDNGVSLIAIGGDKLSRGLTIEGLTVSYFTRTSSLYDTLMQMGRWFGYRTGYEDLCRIYTTNDLFNWYRHISTAFEKLLLDFKEMVKLRATPQEFGLRVLSHPDMMATNALKMRYSETIPLAYKGRFTETISLTNNKDIAAINQKASENLIKKLVDIDGKNDNLLWKNLDFKLIKEFLSDYITSKDSPAANSNRIIEYVESQNRTSILNKWNIGIVSLKSESKDPYFIEGLKIFPITRGLKREIEQDKLYIGRLGSPDHEKLDFDIVPDAIAAELRKLEPRLSTPLFLLYPLYIKDEKDERVGNLHFGFAISWPYNNSLINSTYDINSVYRELEIEKYDD